MAKFKIWIEIEELTDDGDETGRSGADYGILPDCLGVFTEINDAVLCQGAIARQHGTHPESSDACNYASLPILVDNELQNIVEIEDKCHRSQGERENN